jgi:serine/threonine protein kinase/WD40 repeat protein
MSTWDPRANDLFLTAVGMQSAGEREQYLDQACAGDAALRAEVEALLAASAQAGSFLESPEPRVVVTVDEQPGRERPGTMIGPYKLLERIGEGGFGVVFMAEQQQPVRRKVALKVLKPGMDSRQVVARFEAERQALALMDHPNIARVFDGGETGSGRPYFVMELVRGVAITEFCDLNRLSVRERLSLFVDVCAAVQHAHQKGIIHRDLKPSNILVTLHDDKAVVKVIDFGVAKALGQHLTDKTLFTGFSQMIGTPMYMSPEQAQMSGLDMDTRTDIYALGVLLYELLTGATPFDKEWMRTAGYDEIRRILREEEPAKPSTRLSTLGQAACAVSTNRRSDLKHLRRLLRGELDWVVMKALEKDRNRRYDSASSFAADVRRYLNDEPVQACPPSALYRLRKLVRRHQGPVVAVSLILLALVGGIIGTTWGLIHTARARADALDEAGQKTLALAEKVGALASAERSAQDAKDQLFLALFNQARSGRFSRQMGQRHDSLAALEMAARIRPDERLRDEAIAALALPDIRRGPIVDALPASTVGYMFDDRYESYARLDHDGTMTIHRVPDAKEVRCFATGIKCDVAFILWSPDRRWLSVLSRGGPTQIWRIEDEKPLFKMPMPSVSWLDFSADSKRVAIAVKDRLMVHELSTGEETKHWQLPAAVNTLAFHPTNRQLAVSYSLHDVVSVYDTATGSHVADLPVGRMREAAIAWHPDGARLAVAGSDPRIQIWDVARARRVALLEGHAEQVTVLSFHPDGSLLGSGSHEGTARLWEPGTGRQLMQISAACYPRFSSTGRWLGYLYVGDGKMQFLEVTPSREYRTLVNSLRTAQPSFHDGDISPDSRILAVGMSRGGDRLWDLASGKELAVLPSSRSHSVRFQPDGRELLTCGPSGLYRWPIQERNEVSSQISLGPPCGVALPGAPTRVASTPDGKTLAIVSEAAGGGRFVQAGAKAVVGKPLEHPNVAFLDLSRDGKWLVTSGWHSDRVRLWSAETGSMVHEWAPGNQTVVYFTPDSRCVIMSRYGEFSFWDVETRLCVRRLRREVSHLPSRIAFSREGKLMALEVAPGVISLLDVATGRTVARLEDPHGDHGRWMGFTPDGSKLVVVAAYAGAIHVWDLRAIRQRLKAIGLDWDWPEFPPAGHADQAAESVKVEVLPGELAKPILTHEERARRSIDHYRRQVDAKPNDPLACNNLAWFLATAPEPLRDGKAAVPLAQMAVLLAPKNATYRNTLGVAYYRAARYREAAETLRANLDAPETWGLAFDLYFLAMSHHRLGEADRAREYFDWAARWPRTNPKLTAGHLEELALFRAEAAGLVRGETKKD